VPVTQNLGKCVGHDVIITGPAATALDCIDSISSDENCSFDYDNNALNEEGIELRELKNSGRISSSNLFIDDNHRWEVVVEMND